MTLSYLKSHLTYKKIGKHNLFIAPDLPSWIVLDDLEAVILYYLIDGYSIQDLYPPTKDYLSKEDLQPFCNRLLVKLRRRGLYPKPKVLWDAPDAKSFGRNIHLCLTHACNLRCRHCYLSAGVTRDGELTLEEWKTGLGRLLKLIPEPDITISGGEPTVVSFLPDIISFLYERNAKITLYTNGTNNISKLIPFLSGVQVSLDGLSSITHDFIRGNNTFYKTLDFIKNFPQKNCLTIAITLMAHNFDEIRVNLKKFLKDLQLPINQVRINADLENNGRAIALPSYFHDFPYNRMDEVFSYLHGLFNTKPSLLLTNKRNCGIGLSIGIDSNGDIHPCDIFNNRRGSIMQHDLSEILLDLLKLNNETEISSIEECRDCELKYICLGGCKARNYEINKKYTRPYCNDRFKMMKYYRMIYDVGV